MNVFILVALFIFLFTYFKMNEYIRFKAFILEPLNLDAEQTIKSAIPYFENLNSTDRASLLGLSKLAFFKKKYIFSEENTNSIKIKWLISAKIAQLALKTHFNFFSYLNNCSVFILKDSLLNIADKSFYFKNNQELSAKLSYPLNVKISIKNKTDIDLKETENPEALIAYYLCKKYFVKRILFKNLKASSNISRAELPYFFAYLSDLYFTNQLNNDLNEKYADLLFLIYGYKPFTKD
jgi:hypothetical protein